MNLGGSIKINRCGLLIIFCILLMVIYYLMSGKSSSTDDYHYSVVKNPNKINLRKLLIGSIQAAQKGGVEVALVSKSADINEKSKGKTKEGANDPFTDADLKSHCAMQIGLQRIFPKLEIISEEDVPKSSCPDVKPFDLDPTVLQETVDIPDENVDIEDIKVWIDPLDATQEFTESLYEYVTTMVCVAVKGRPVIGVIHNPFTGKTAWSWDGRADSDGLKNKRDEPFLARNPIIIVSRSHTGDVKEFATKTFGDTTRVITAGGAGYKVLQVIYNNATAYIHKTNIKKWDICAGNAILNSLGGKMTNLLNEDIDYSSGMKPLNDKGLLASLHNHDSYMEKILANKNKN